MRSARNLLVCFVIMLWAHLSFAGVHRIRETHIQENMSYSLERENSQLINGLREWIRGNPNKNNSLEALKKAATQFRPFNRAKDNSKILSHERNAQFFFVGFILNGEERFYHFNIEEYLDRKGTVVEEVVHDIQGSFRGLGRFNWYFLPSFL